MAKLRLTGFAFAATVVAVVSTFFATSQSAFASIGEIEKQVALLASEAKKSDYSERLKRRYFLSNVELKVFHRRGLSDAQITVAAQIAEASGKMTYEVVNMRVDEKMSWGQITKRLGVPPQLLVQLLEQMHRPPTQASPRAFAVHR